MTKHQRRRRSALDCALAAAAVVAAVVSLADRANGRRRPRGSGHHQPLGPSEGSLLTAEICVSGASRDATWIGCCGSPVGRSRVSTATSNQQRRV